MKEFNQQSLEKRLVRQSYQAIDLELDPLPSEVLLKLLDSKSIKIGDTATGILQRRKETAMVLDALLHDRFRTVLGRLRATHLLNCFGCSIPEAIDGYLHALNDRSTHVVSNALFGIVFMRRKDLIPTLMKHMNAASEGSPRYEQYNEAIDALKANDPSKYSPGFCDLGNIWRLNG